ncbi:metallophosphoesterase [Aureispira sp. CCB-E]|uniref:metallophosphoesterase n=1 Tax=Aureispira sp. CCB-E TaxID=3051121 RepID=UPI002868709E|nr:metallophosphoesterase [Aureispira sp. CCB-E]WMX13478.1 metallophosphoesterase [Aureispira sp. CCB-E]
MTILRTILWTICLMGSVVVCTNAQDTLTYAFFGHPYQGDPDGKKVDFRLEAMDMSQFDGIWLGGDVGSEAALKYTNLQYLDSLFDLDNPMTHWALGNHDTRNGNLEWIEEFTERPSFYAYSSNGLTVVVLDGNITPLDCEKLNAQYNLVKSVCDTIQSGHLVFLIHHGIAIDVPGVSNPITYAHNEAQNWMAHCYHDSSSYTKSIYPLMVNAKQRGVNVFHIMGDTGSWYKSFHETSVDGVEYLAAGLGNGYRLQTGQTIYAADVAIIFKHVLANNQLTWSFVEINDL